MAVQINGDTGNVSATKADFSGNISIGGTLTYEDVTNVDSVGLVTARSGIEIGARPGVAASISVDGNAIFSGITTVGSHMAVGGVTPEIFGGGYVTLEVAGSTNDNGGVFKSATSGSAGSGSSGIEMLMNTDPVGGSINVVTSHPLKFATANTERARFDTGGRLLIGTTTEGQADADNLTIADSGSCGITIRSGTSAAGAIYFSDATSGAAEYDGAIVYNQSSQYMSVYTAQTQRLRINSNGSLNIQNTSGYNTYDVDISNAGATDTAVQIRPNDGNAGEAQLFIGGGGSSQNKCALIFDPAGGYCRGSLHICMENTADTSNVDSSDNKLSISPEGYVTKPAQFHIVVSRSGNQTGYNPSQGFGTGVIYNNSILEQGTTSAALDTTNGRVTVPVAGIYFLEGSAYSSTAAFTQGWFTKNGSRLAYSDFMDNSGLSQNVNSNGFHKLAANDTIGFKAYGSQHTSVTVEASIYHTWMRITLVG